jgi:hypothetical protein
MFEKFLDDAVEGRIVAGCRIPSGMLPPLVDSAQSGEKPAKTKKNVWRIAAFRTADALLRKS